MNYYFHFSMSSEDKKPHKEVCCNELKKKKVAAIMREVDRLRDELMRVKNAGDEEEVTRLIGELWTLRDRKYVIESGHVDISDDAAIEEIATKIGERRRRGLSWFF